ncbi:putative holin-like toxin [Metabacillus sp. RGM 3146]
MKGGVSVSVFESLVVMMTFGSLVIAILTFQKKK